MNESLKLTLEDANLTDVLLVIFYRVDRILQSGEPFSGSNWAKTYLF